MSSSKDRDSVAPSERMDLPDEDTDVMAGGGGSARASTGGPDSGDTSTMTSRGAPPIVIEGDRVATSAESADVMKTEPLVDSPPSPDLDSTERMGLDDRVDATDASPSAGSSALHPMLLERIEPSLGRGERLRLDAARRNVSIGRGEQCDLRLYTASASREHAVIEANEDGEWVLKPSVGKSVLIDDDATTEPVVLEVGMNLIFGQDHLRCVTESLDDVEMEAQTLADGFDQTRSSRLAGLRQRLVNATRFGKRKRKGKG